MAKRSKHQDADAASLICAGHEFLQDAETLRAKHGHATNTVCFLAAFGIEVLLKSVFADEPRLPGDDKLLYSHDLINLWPRAYRVPTSPIGKKLPKWLSSLADSHKDHLYRYPPRDVDAWVVPGVTAWPEISALLDRVVAWHAIRGTIRVEA